MNKKKIFNDPVYGFINITDGLIFDLIEHPYFQRLRRIKQLGLNDYVYPGALHTRFHHAIGAMHLMKVALQNLRDKDISISDEEFEAATTAILLHDIGHGPFSHSLENSLLTDSDHEKISRIIIEHINSDMGGKLDMVLDIFNGTYHRQFLNQLVSSQLDIDRLDYLSRDSFFTGVSEGTIGSERIIKMLTVCDDELVIEEKGIYSIENFLIARRLMYWQVYLHKTAVSAEKMLHNLIERAKELISKGQDLPCPLSLRIFLEKEISLEMLENDAAILEAYCKLDDSDIWSCIKSWSETEDPVLSDLSQRLLERRLFRVQILSEPPEDHLLEELSARITDKLGIDGNTVNYYYSTGEISNAAYIDSSSKIKILSKSGKVRDIREASDLPNIKAISKIVKKYYLCWPKAVSL